jgi:hypothetical protein
VTTEPPAHEKLLQYEAPALSSDTVAEPHDLFISKPFRAWMNGLLKDL